MMLDQRFQLCMNQQVLTTAASTKSVDLTTLLRDFGDGDALYIDINVTAGFAVADPATDVNNIVFSLQLTPTDDGSGGVQTLLGSTVIYYANGNLLAPGIPLGAYALTGDHIIIPINPLSDGQRRYIKAAALLGVPFRYMTLLMSVTNVAGAGFTAGSVSAALTLNPTSRVSIAEYADALN